MALTYRHTRDTRLILWLCIKFCIKPTNIISLLRACPVGMGVSRKHKAPKWGPPGGTAPGAECRSGHAVSH